MKQRIGSSVSSYSMRENEVAEILVKLRSLVWEFECSRGILPLSWGQKKKRSVIGVNPKAEEASSPATPLSFSPSESDENPTSLFRRNVSLKRKREHCLKIIQDLTKDNDLLSGVTSISYPLGLNLIDCKTGCFLSLWCLDLDPLKYKSGILKKKRGNLAYLWLICENTWQEIKNVKCYFDKLKDYNLKLKAKKQELSHGPRQGVVVQKQPQFPDVARHSPLILNQAPCGLATTSLGVPSSSSNDVGPVGIPDLNLPLEESMSVEFCESLDVNVSVANRNLSRAIAAQARQNRLHIYRFKNSIGISKPRYSCR